MSEFEPPLYISDVFNSMLFEYNELTPLTIYDADRRYLRVTGGTVSGYTTFNNSIAINGNIVLNGSAVDLTSIIGSTHGTISADKAVIVDANMDITGFRYLSATETVSGASIDASVSYKVGGTTIVDASRNATFATLALGATTISEAEIGVLDAVVAGTAAASKALVLDASKNITGIGSISATSVDSNSAIKIGGTTVIDSNRDAVVRNITATNFKSTSYDLDDADFGKLDGIVNGTAAANKCLVLSSNKDIGIIRRISVKNMNIQGDTGSTDDYSNLARLLNVIDSAMGNASSRYFTLGKEFATGNSGEISFRYEGNNDSNNRMAFGGYGFSDVLNVFATSTVSIGTTTRSGARLFIANGISNSTIAGSSQVEILANSGMSQSIAPVIVSNPSIKTDGNVIIGGALYVSSDRRLKRDIHPFSAKTAMRFVKECRPVMYKLKDETRQQYGYIAQELMAKSFGQLIELEQDDEMHSEGSVYDFEGYRLSVSYDRVCTLLHRAMQQMLNELAEHKEAIRRLQK